VSIEFRDYDPAKDKDAVHRIWEEIGWIEKEEDKEALDVLLAGSKPLVAVIDGEAECLAATTPGTIRYLEEDLSFAALDGVTTGRIARKQGLASQLTALAVARAAEAGTLVCGLGTFEQGFYDQLGFGTGSYQHRCSFDPAQLTVKIKPRIPMRLDTKDWERVHASRLARRRGHGGCNLTASEMTRAEMLWSRNGFGLGYTNGENDALTHHFWGSTKEAESGPYRIEWMAYQSREQFLELMALLKSLGDQVHLIRLSEPSDIQFQDLLAKPFKMRRISQRSQFESNIRASAYWQIRICDLAGCLEKTHLVGSDSVDFNLNLTDPIERFLQADAPWRGIAGEYVVTLGPASSAEDGKDPSLPTLTASVGAFGRMWLGVRSATSLSYTDELTAPRELLEGLDRTLQLPTPDLDWDF
jgi:hypothetical protein